MHQFHVNAMSVEEAFASALISRIEPNPDGRGIYERDFARLIDLADRRRRFRWQAAVSGPGSSGVNQNGCAPGPQHPRIKT